MKKTLAKTVMLAMLLAFAFFNIKYIFEIGGDIRCYGVTMLLRNIVNKQEAMLNLIMFIVFMSILIITYLIIVSKEKKDSNKKEMKNVFLLIGIVTIIASFIVPNNSTDVYYYSAIGRLDSQYGVNMYEENFNEASQSYLEDNIIKASPQVKHKFIYGPVWALVCKLIGYIKTNIVAIPIFIFKLLNIIVHMLNCYLIYKISKNKKLVLLYGLNPLMIFEGIINVHNDIFLILFSLIGIYLKKQNKIGLAVLSITLGALIKYIPVLLLPYIIFDEKFKNKVLYLLEFALVFIGTTFILTGDIMSILTVMQQTGIYANSVYLQMYMHNIQGTALSRIALIGKILFCLIYFFKIFIQKKNEGKTYMWLIMLFMLLVITNFRAWYIMWLFGIITEIDMKDVNKLIELTLIGQFANYIPYYLGEGYMFGEYYFMMVIFTFLVYLIVDNLKEQNGIINKFLKS